MKGKSFFAIGVTAVTMVLTGIAWAQAPQGGQAAGAESQGEPGKPGPTEAQAPTGPMGPGMMGGPWMMGRGAMGPGGMGRGAMGGMMGPWMMGRHGMMGGPWMMGHHGMMGPHGHPGMMMAPWMMGQHGMMGGWGHGRRTELSADDVKRVIDGRLAWHGLKHLKVGAVKIVDDDTASADVVTKEGSLAVRLRVDRNTGYAVIAE